MDTSAAEIEISLLGSWQLHYRAGPTKKEPRRKEQALLAYLAVEADQAHSRDSLVGLFWPDMPAADARNNLRVALSRLKKHLGDGSCLETTRHAVRFIPTDQVQLDVTQFLNLINSTDGHEHASLAACRPCRERLDQAVKLYRGEFLAGFFLEDCLAFEEWLFVWRERLHVQMLKQLDQLAQAAESNGHFAYAGRYARRQIELDPLHESAHRQLMRALAAEGQRSAALNQFQTCVTVLQDELGVEPEAETLHLYQEIQAGTFARTSSGLGISPTSRQYSLPEHTTPFIGREKEVDQLSHRFEEQNYRLISLVGPGGIGKTRLALQAARAGRDIFEDGVYFVPLDAVQTAAEIPAAIAEVLDITFSGSESPQSEIIQILRDKHCLLVIDNLEHVIDGGADLLLAILQAVPAVILLVTSRERVNVQGEDLFRLRGLPYPNTDDNTDAARYAAVRLFVDRAHRINKEFGLSSETLNHVVNICRLVEGLPLGIELAATWVRDFSIQEIAASLETDFDLLQTNLRDVSSRHRSIATVFEHSWGLLTPAEQKVLPQLAAFRGGFTLTAAQNVTGASPLVLTRLRYKSLLRGDGNGRYSMHELLRQLAHRKLNQNPALAAETQTKHSYYFLYLLQEQAEYLKGIDAAQVGAALRLDLDNIRQAWRWAVETSALDYLQQSAGGLVTFLEHVGLAYEGTQLLQFAIDSPSISADPESGLLPLLLVKQLYLFNSISTLDENIATIERILSLTAENPTLSHLEAETCLIWSRDSLQQVSEPKQARVYLNRAFAGAEKIDDPEFEARLQCESGRNYLYDGQFDKAILVLEKALTIYEELDHIPGQAMTYSHLAPAYAEAYRLGPALFCDRKALFLYTQVDNRAKLGVAHNNLAETYVLLGAYEEAKEHTVKSLEISRRQGNKVDEANTLALYAVIMARLGQTGEAEKQFRVAIAAQKELKLNFSLRFSLLDWGTFQQQRDWLAEAEITYNEAVDLNNDVHHLKLTSQAKLATVQLAQGKLQPALVLADKVWQELESTGGEGLPFPLNTMYECYSIFQACEDDRAGAVLQMAANVLKRTAAEIEDPEMRTSFLNNVLVNQQLQAVLQQPSK